MLLRVATLADLNPCLALDADSQTDHVWQMDKREIGGMIAVRFQAVRLPRAMRVAYPRRRDDLLSCWESGSLILVASDKAAVDAETAEYVEAQEVEAPQVYAYCQS